MTEETNDDGQAADTCVREKAEMAAAASESGEWSTW